MAPESRALRVNLGRLRADIEALAEIGLRPSGGLNRSVFSPATRMSPVKRLPPTRLPSAASSASMRGRPRDARGKLVELSDA